MILEVFMLADGDERSIAVYDASSATASAKRCSVMVVLTPFAAANG
jgi:hypothetical protein